MSGVVQIKAVPGNNACADCGAAECSGSHRSLGTHISKVRSLQLDVECWQGELLDFFTSVGNTAFNNAWEAKVGEHVVRPQEFPLIPYVRQHFITRKYVHKHFLSCCATGHCEICSLSSTPGEPASVLRSGMVVKLGGKASTVFRRWQPRLLVLSSERGLDYYKSEATSPLPSPSTSQGNIDLRGGGYSVYLLSDSTVEGQSGCFFGIDTPESHPEHLGRKFLFKCSDDADRVAWVEALRSYVVHLSGASCAVPRSLLSNHTPETSPTSLLSHLCHLREEFCTSSALDIIHSGLLLHRSPLSTTYEQRWCVLTSEAFFITSADCKAGATEMGLGAVEVKKSIFASLDESEGFTSNGEGTMRPAPAHIIPLRVCYVDDTTPKTPTEQIPFGVWCPLDYSFLATSAEVNTDAAAAKSQWIKAIKDAASEVRQVLMTTTSTSST